METLIGLIFLFMVVLLTIGILFQPNKEEMYPKSGKKDMGIYRELDYRIFNICYTRYLHAKTEIGDDNSGYYVFFIGDDKHQNVKEAIKLIENLGLRKIDHVSTMTKVSVICGMNYLFLMKQRNVIINRSFNRL